MLTPRKMKYRKLQKGGKIGRIATKGNTLVFGRYGLKALESGRIAARQIEAARRAATRSVKKGGEIWIRIFPDTPVTALPLETGMGGGKGDVSHFIVKVKPGKILFEIDGVSQDLALDALRLASHKLPIKTKLIQR